MINVTPVYGFEKPTPDEFFDYELENRNMDRAEGALCALNADLEKSVGAIGAQLLNKATGNPATGDARNAEKVLGTDKIITLDGTGYMDIPAGADLNDVKYRGFGQYRCRSDVVAKTLINSPFSNAFTMTVSPGNGITYPQQSIKRIVYGETKTRTWSPDTNAWTSDWRDFAQQIPTLLWKPELRGGETTVNCTYGWRIGRCAIIGNICNLHLSIEITNINQLPTGEIRIYGFPVAPKSNESAADVSYVRGGVNESMRKIIIASVYANYICLREFNNNGLWSASFGGCPVAQGKQDPSIIITLSTTFEIA